MSQRRQLQQQLRQLADIRDIMDAMKNLAMVEILKLKTRLENQQEMVVDLERMAADFLDFYPYSSAGGASDTDILVLFGSERGFCGDFNDAIIRNLEQQIQSSPGKRVYLIPVGGKLAQRLEDREDVSRLIDGADVAEEITQVLNNIINCIGRLQSEFRSVNVHVLFHHADTGELICEQLIPPFKHFMKEFRHYGNPPVLNLPPPDFFSELVHEYLYTCLNEIACMSLLSENYKRIQHMTGAIQQLDERTEDLTRYYHVHRQEEITEEIEVILLNTSI